MSIPEPKYFYYFGITTFSITFAIMKRTILTVEIEPELKEHLDKQALAKRVTVSRLVRAAIKKATKFKERDLV